MMSRYGLLIDYEFCTGCHSCEMACKAELGLPEGKWGIKLSQVGPWELEPGEWEWSYVPIPTQLCDLCDGRLAEGKLPACVHHCQSLVMEHGRVEDLAAKIDKPKMVLFVPR